MKKLVSFLIAVALLGVSAVPLCAAANLPDEDLSAATPSTATTLDSAAEEGYEITELEVEEASSPTTSAGSSTVTGSKTSTRYNALGQRLYSYTLRATFTYNGSSASASSVSYSYRIYNSRWSFRSATTRKSRNTAYGTGTFTYGWSTKNVSLKISCSAKGKLS